MLNVFKALADPTRLRLLRILHYGEFTVQELTDILEMGQSRISRHLKILCAAGILSVEQQGTWRYYSIKPASDFVANLWSLMLPGLAAVDGHSSDKAGVDQIMNERRQRSRDFFNQHANDWDRLAASRLSLPDYSEELLHMVEGMSLVLEVGIGSGQMLKLLADAVPAVIGVDHSPEMLKKSRHLLLGNDHVDLRLGEMAHLPLADQSVPAVVLNQVLHHGDRPQEVIAEIARVLNPGGYLVIADLVRHEHDWVREELADQWLGFARDEIEDWLEQSSLDMIDFTVLPSTSRGFEVFLLGAVKQIGSH